MADFLGGGDQICHPFALNNGENILLPSSDVSIGRSDLIVFCDCPADGAELTPQRVRDDHFDAIAVQRSCQGQGLGKSSYCQKCGSHHSPEPIMPLCTNSCTVFMSNNLYAIGRKVALKSAVESFNGCVHSNLRESTLARRRKMK